MQAPDTSRWSNKRFSDGDPLYRLVKAEPRAASGFFWASHTFSHPLLDNFTSAATKLQLDLNARMAGPVRRAALVGLELATASLPAAALAPAVPFGARRLP
jgi:hypothetical protein